MKKRYIKKLNMSLSPLGFGVMRLSFENGVFSKEVYETLIKAYECGINYFDTAYYYLGGQSEVLIREAIVSRFPRDSYYIADKLPVWVCRNMDDMERIFNEQLERLGVSYIDFYLLHSLHRSRWQDIYNKGVLDFLQKKLNERKIKKIGFSFHDAFDELSPILDAFEWDFVQLQVNYYDWITQHANKSYNILEKRGIPCIAMSSVGGGRLSILPDKEEKILKEISPNDTSTAWALRFVSSLPNVAVALSGMNNIKQLSENLSIYESFSPLSSQENKALQKVVENLREYNAVPCTACGYCMDDCPKEIDIAQTFKRYNDYKQFDNTAMARFDVEYKALIPLNRMAMHCIECGICVKNCPQKINIPEKLKEIDRFIVELSLGCDIGLLKQMILNGFALICFGAGNMGRSVNYTLAKENVKLDFFCDNRENIWETEIDGVKVISPERLHKLSQDRDVCVLITSSFYSQIKEQLDKIGIKVLN